MMNIYTSLDERYVPYGAVFLQSLLEHNQNLKIGVLDCGISNESKHFLGKLVKSRGVSIDFRRVNFQRGSLPVSHHFTEANYARLLIPEIFNVNKGISLYIDADTLIRGNLEPLVKTPLLGYPLAAVGHSRPEEHIRRLGLNEQSKYLNSGVLLIDNEKFITLMTGFLEIIEKRGESLEYVDQDVLNIALGNNWLELSPIWNLTNEIALIEPKPNWAKELIERSKIIHFTGKEKPLYGKNEDHPFHKRFHQTLAQTEVRVPTAKTHESRPKIKEVFGRSLSKIGNRSFAVSKVGSKLGEHAIRQENHRVLESRHGRWVKRQRDLADTYFTDQKVLSGIFRGMPYLDTAFGSALLPKLLGSYESELHESISQLTGSRKYSVIYDVECAEGYYAAGLGRMCPDAHVFAYDINGDARTACRKLVDLCEASNVEIKEFFDLSELIDLDGESGLILCDCEGYEAEIFNRLDPNLSKLVNYDLIIECHDCFRPGITAGLIHELGKTHQIDVISSLSKHAKARSFSTQGMFIKYSDLTEICDERRGETMEWLVCKAPRNS